VREHAFDGSDHLTGITQHNDSNLLVVGAPTTNDVYRGVL
jgi:hypothetical protein